MRKWVDSIEQLVGNTPLMELKNYEKAHGCVARLLAKLEWFNPTGSIKDRAALNMIRAAESEGKIAPGDVIVEQTSGNTGIGLAAFALSRGYDVEIFLERGASVERRLLLEAYGAGLLNYRDALGISTPEEHAQGWKEPEREATLQEIYDYCKRQSKGGRNYYFMDQTANLNNPQAHILTTGPEIWEATDGQVDILVCMAGTGGTMSGLYAYFSEKNPEFQLVLVQPHPEARLTEENPHANIIDGVLAVADVSDDELSDFLVPKLCSEYFNVRFSEAAATAQELIRSDGLLVGTSAAAALYAAAIVAKREENAGKNVVVIMPDSGMKYLSTALYR